MDLGGNFYARISQCAVRALAERAKERGTNPSALGRALLYKALGLTAAGEELPP